MVNGNDRPRLNVGRLNWLNVCLLAIILFEMCNWAALDGPSFSYEVYKEGNWFFFCWVWEMKELGHLSSALYFCLVSKSCLRFGLSRDLI